MPVVEGAQVEAQVVGGLLDQSFPIVYRDESRHCSVALQGSSAAWLISRSHRLARHR